MSDGRRGSQPPSRKDRDCCSHPVLLECRMFDHRSFATPPVAPALPPRYADVVLPRRLHRPFTYLIPSSLKGQVAIGQSVIVPFGSQDLHGLVTAVYDRLPLGAPEQGLKAVRCLAPASPAFCRSGRSAAITVSADRAGHGQFVVT